MTRLFRFGSQNGRRRGLLAFSLAVSGTKIRLRSAQEIGEKTHRLSIPGKGTLCPLLHQMETDQLIFVKIAEPRSRKIYWSIIKGEETLSPIKTKSREPLRKLILYKKLIHKIFRNDQSTSRSILLQVETLLEEILPRNEDRTQQILEMCLMRVKELPRR
jgi:DNA-binding PadR family transcriptional regulator